MRIVETKPRLVSGEDGDATTIPSTSSGGRSC